MASSSLELVSPPGGFRGMVTAQEYEVACVAHFMGYELLRCADGGYVLSRKFGNADETVKAPTLEEITEYLKH